MQSGLNIRLSVFDLSYNIPIFPSFNLVRAEYALGPELITIKLFQSLDDGLMVLERRYSNKVKFYVAGAIVIIKQISGLISGLFFSMCGYSQNVVKQKNFYSRLLRKWNEIKKAESTIAVVVVWTVMTVWAVTIAWAMSIDWALMVVLVIVQTVLLVRAIIVVWAIFVVWAI